MKKNTPIFTYKITDSKLTVTSQDSYLGVIKNISLKYQFNNSSSWKSKQNIRDYFKKREQNTSHNNTVNRLSCTLNDVNSSDSNKMCNG